MADDSNRGPTINDITKDDYTDFRLDNLIDGSFGQISAMEDRRSREQSNQMTLPSHEAGQKAIHDTFEYYYPGLWNPVQASGNATGKIVSGSTTAAARKEAYLPSLTTPYPATIEDRVTARNRALAPVNTAPTLAGGKQVTPYPASVQEMYAARANGRINDVLLRTGGLPSVAPRSTQLSGADPLRQENPQYNVTPPQPTYNPTYATSGGYLYESRPGGGWTNVGADPAYEGMSAAERYDAVNRDAQERAWANSDRGSPSETQQSDWWTQATGGY